MNTLLVATLLAAPDAGTVRIVARAPAVVLPFGVDFGPKGETYFVEMKGGDRLALVAPDGGVAALAGGKGTDLFDGPHGLAVGGDGRVFVADTWHSLIKVWHPATGLTATYSGSGRKAFAGDGKPAVAAEYSDVFALAFDPKKRNLYVADLGNRRVRKIGPTGTVSTVAGNGTKGVPADGTRADAGPLVDPRAVAADDAGTVFVLERGGHALRAVDAAGTITTVVGTGKPGSRLGLKPLQCELNGPKHVCVAPDNSVLIADTDNHRVLKWDRTANTVTVILGTGSKGSKFNLDPMTCELNQPHGVAVHPTTGDVYVCDSHNNRILRLSR